MKIREARREDAEGIAKVHVRSWQTTYRGLISDTYLSRLTVDQRLRNWLRTFDSLKPGEPVYVAETGEGEIVGFSSGGRNRSDDGRYDGELYAIYLLREYQGMGLGKRLFDAVMTALRTDGCASMMLWVLRDNPALAFYESRGGRVVDRKTVAIGEEDLDELALGWDRI